MGHASDWFPAVGTFGHKWYPEDLAGVMTPGMNDTGRYWYVDGDVSGSGGDGKSWATAFGEGAFDGNISALNVLAGDTIFVAGRTMARTDTDPTNYTTNLNINVPQVSLIGVSRGRTQGGLPQFKVGGTTTSAIITISAPGVLVANIGINGAGATGGGILIDDDGGSTKSVFGWAVVGCHFKNCVGTTATNAATGGAIQWAATGGGWQGLIAGNRFYKNVGDVVLKGTTGSVPQDIVIEGNVFSGPASSVDCNLYLAGGSGMNGVIVNNNVFTAMPAIGSGSNVRFADMTGCVGILSNNTFATTTDPGLTELTFAAAGTGAKIPATVFMANNTGEVQATGNTTNHAAIGRYA